MNRIASVLGATFLLAASSGIALAGGETAPPSHSTPVQPLSPAELAARRHDGAALLEQRMTHALNLLEARGYGDFSNFRPAGKNFAAEVTRNGKAVTVTIDPDSNRVTQG